MTQKTAILIISFLTLLLATNAQEPKLVIPVDNRANSVNFSPDGKYIVSAGGDNIVRMWEFASGKIIHTLRVPSDIDWYLSAFITNDNKYIIAASKGTTYAWDVVTEKLLYTVKNEATATNFCLSSDQKHIIISGWNGYIHSK